MGIFLKAIERTLAPSSSILLYPRLCRDKESKSHPHYKGYTILLTYHVISTLYKWIVFSRTMVNTGRIVVKLSTSVHALLFTLSEKISLQDLFTTTL